MTRRRKCMVWISSVATALLLLGAWRLEPVVRGGVARPLLGMKTVVYSRGPGNGKVPEVRCYRVPDLWRYEWSWTFPSVPVYCKEPNRDFRGDLELHDKRAYVIESRPGQGEEQYVVHTLNRGAGSYVRARLVRTRLAPRLRSNGPRRNGVDDWSLEKDFWRDGKLHFWETAGLKGFASGAEGYSAYDPIKDSVTAVDVVDALPEKRRGRYFTPDGTGFVQVEESAFVLRDAAGGKEIARQPMSHPGFTTCTPYLGRDAWIFCTRELRAVGRGEPARYLDVFTPGLGRGLSSRRLILGDCRPELPEEMRWRAGPDGWACFNGTDFGVHSVAGRIVVGPWAVSSPPVDQGHNAPWGAIFVEIDRNAEWTGRSFAFFIDAAPKERESDTFGIAGRITIDGPRMWMVSRKVLTVIDWSETHASEKAVRTSTSKTSRPRAGTGRRSRDEPGVGT